MKDYLLIFDFDGCVIDSFNVQENAYNESCKKVLKGQEYPPFSEFLKYSGDSLPNIISKLGLPLEIVELYKEYSNSNIDKIIINKQLIELLRKIHINNKIAICSGKDHKRTVDILDYYQISDIFDEIVCSDDVSEPKPSPMSVDRIINTLGFEKDKVIFVGDAQNDYQCAKNAQAQFILSAWYIDNSETIKTEYIAKTIDEFERILNNI